MLYLIILIALFCNLSSPLYATPDQFWRDTFSRLRSHEERQDGVEIAKILINVCSEYTSGFTQDIILRKITSIQDHVTLMSIINHLKDNKEIFAAELLLSKFRDAPEKRQYLKDLEAIIDPRAAAQAEEQQLVGYEPIDDYQVQEPTDQEDERIRHFSQHGPAQLSSGNRDGMRSLVKLLVRRPMLIGVAVGAVAWYVAKKWK